MIDLNPQKEYLDCSPPLAPVCGQVVHLYSPQVAIEAQTGFCWSLNHSRPQLAAALREWCTSSPGCSSAGAASRGGLALILPGSAKLCKSPSRWRRWRSRSGLDLDDPICLAHVQRLPDLDSVQQGSVEREPRSLGTALDSCS